MGRRFGRRGVHINDPDKGRRFVPMEDFDTSFTGVVLVLEPGDDFERGGRKPGVLGAMPARLRGTTGTMLAALLASLLLVAVGAAVPALSRTYIDMFLIGGQTSLLGVLFASMGACVALTLVLTWLQQANLLRGRIISSTLSSARFLRHLLRLPGHLLLPAQPGRPGPATPVERRGGRDTGPRPRGGGRRRASSSCCTPCCCGRTTRNSRSSASASRCSTSWPCGW